MKIVSKLNLWSFKKSFKIFITLFIAISPTQVFAQSTSIVCSTDKTSLIQSIKLVPNSTDQYSFNISPQGQMPTMKFTVDFESDGLSSTDKDCLRQELQSNFSWNLLVEYWDGTAKGQHRILSSKLGAQRSGLGTGDGWEYSAADKASTITVTAMELGNKFGGGADGSVDVSLKLADRTLTASMPLSIWADSVDKTDIKLALGDLKYQLLGYLESKFIHIYHGIPLLNCGDETCSVSDGGFGLMQMTDCSGAGGTLSRIPTKLTGGHGFPSYNQIWDWQANALAGKSCYDIKVQYSCSGLAAGSDKQLECGYTSYNGSASYGNLGITILNEMRGGRFRAGWF